MVKEAREKIRFHYQSAPFFFPDRNKLKDFILKLFRLENQKVQQVSFIFCTDEYLLELNQQFLDHDTLTDIITFPLAKDPVVAEVYISIDRVRENARLFNVTTLTELKRVVFHGALHLCGYKDKTTPQLKLMREKENYYLGRCV